MTISSAADIQNKWLSPAGPGRCLSARMIDAVIVGLLCYLPGTRGSGLPEYVIGYF